MDYHVNNGIYKLDFELSKLERQILQDCSNILEKNGFHYLSVPSTITAKTFNSQEINVATYQYGDNEILAGSAEQGILEYFSDATVHPTKVYAQNTCFRTEGEFEDLKRVKEFIKVEQFVFCHLEDVEKNFNLLLENAKSLLKKYNILYREIDVTEKDMGYHKRKVDIEVWTEKFGWLETHSCAYFGLEQSKRYNIKGATHTLSCTGIATPRILVPLIERALNKNGKKFA